MIELSVVIVSYNTAELTCDCLESVQAADGADRREVIVIDNASTDGSPGRIAERFPAVRLIANAENRGFAAANNQALPHCRGRYLFFLNPDTRVGPDAFTRSVSHLEAHPEIGLAGLRIVNPDGTPQESVSFRYPGQKRCRGELDGLPGRIACVLGAAMIAPADRIRKLGGFDEAFFLYGEDQDLALRIRRSGCEIGLVPTAVVVHYGGQSEASTGPSAMWEKKVRAENVFYRKHYRPETVRRIRRAELWKAAWRRLTLRLALPFSRDRKKILAKLERYEAVARVTARMTLEERVAKGGILVVQLGDIGDAVLTFPALRALRENFPSTRLVVCVRDKARDLMEDCVWTDGVVAIAQGKRGLRGAAVHHFRFFRSLRKNDFSLAIELRTGTRGALLAFLSGAPCRIGRFDDDGPLRNRLFTHLVRPEGELGQYSAEHSLNILAPLELNIRNRTPEIAVSEGRRREALALLEREGVAMDRPVFAIHPFSLWRYKEWRLDQWILLINDLVERFQCSVIITGSPDERVRAREIPAGTAAGVFNLAGKTSVGLLPAVMQACDLFIGVDTAALHIAAAVGTPTIGIFGPSSPVCWAPRGDDHSVVSREMPCVPCREKGCSGSEISRCLEELSFTEVRDGVVRHFSTARRIKT